MFRSRFSLAGALQSNELLLEVRLPQHFIQQKVLFLLRETLAYLHFRIGFGQEFDLDCDLWLKLQVITAKEMMESLKFLKLRFLVHRLKCFGQLWRKVTIEQIGFDC